LVWRSFSLLQDGFLNSEEERNFDFVELTSVRKKQNILRPSVFFVASQQMKCKHFFVLLQQKFVFSLT